MKYIIKAVLITTVLSVIGLAGLSACTPAPFATSTVTSTVYLTTTMPVYTINVSGTGNDAYLVDSRGYSLYYTTQDLPGSPDVNDPGVPSIWPIFFTINIYVPAALSPGNFNNITRGDSVPQTLYNGYPLYYYSGDTVPGQTNGDGIEGLWHLAKLTAFPSSTTQ